MLVILGALLAGILTTLAPCVLPMLPVIVGSSIVGTGTADTEAGRLAARQEARRRAYVITASLGISLGLFTLLLKASTALIDIPPEVWSAVAGGLLIALGLAAVFPAAWDWISMRLSLQARTTRGLTASRQRSGLTGQILTGVALGPVFSSCSPLYGYVVVTVLPSDLGYGMVLLGAYLVGLCGTLLAISLAGQRLLSRVRWIADPHGWFRRALGAVFILIGLVIITGYDKTIQTWILEYSPIAPWKLDSEFIPRGGSPG